MALHARTAKRHRILDADTRQQLPLRVVLLILALVPSVAMTVLWAVNSNRLYDNWHSVSNHNTQTVRYATPVFSIFYGLQVERHLSAAALTDPAGYQAKLAAQRHQTDAGIASLKALTGPAPADILAGAAKIETGLQQLGTYRFAVDAHSVSQQQIYDDYTGLITTDLELFNSLSDVGLADLNFQVRPEIDSVWGIEILAREDALLTPGIVGGTISSAQRTQLAKLAGIEQFIYDDKVVPLLPAAAGGQYRALIASNAWQQKTGVMQYVIASAPSTNGIALPAALGAQWEQSISAITPQLQGLNIELGTALTKATSAEVHGMATDLILVSAVGFGGVLLIVLLTIFLTGVLRRRIFALRTTALELQVRLPDVVERLRRGETVDTDAELPALHYGGDELGMLGQALNAARASALETAVHQVEQYRGFERLLQRIARRTQLLIGLQMKRVTELERRYEDAELLEGLFELDHLTARLRRYEENLVILGGGQPQRRWRKPVALLDVLRSAQGEVQDYRRIRIETDNTTWLSERAVGPVVHMLAELMENAVAFSKPPTPVEVTASLVAHGLAIEIEDRGVGMAPEQYIDANTMMFDPPKLDVVSRADDARLGLYVVARLAAGLGIKVELRASSYGGTRVVVLLPTELVHTGRRPSVPDDAAEQHEQTSRRLSAVESTSADTATHAPAFLDLDGNRPSADSRYPASTEEGDLALSGIGVRLTSVPAESGSGNTASELKPLPKRVRLASLATELREHRSPGGQDTGATADEQDAPTMLPLRSGATIGAFQRQSRLARRAADDEDLTTQTTPGLSATREEDGR
ncbi:MAG TPA: nitrate- and nitrite sensing domain-containing protein [Actinocrinis sp.]|nr:nitrate- and nitrite sensing domain-containing protein [Actinocrinis sp.]